MSQENIENTQIEIPVETTTEVAQEQQVQLSEAELTAREQGWRPKEEYAGDTSKWVDADEFLRRGELFSKISTQNHEIKQLKQAMNHLIDHNRKVEQLAYQRAEVELKAQKKEALTNGDADAVLEIDEQLADIREQKREQKAQTREEVAANVPPQYYAFVQNNPWYTKDSEMTEFADSYGAGLKAKDPSIDINDFFAKVHRAIRKQFPEKWQRPAVQSTVEGGTARPKQTTEKYTPSTEERKIAQEFARLGIMTEQEYYKQLKGGK